MAEFPENLRYVDSHEWARLEDDGTITVGISDHAQDALGDVVFVELPEIDVVVGAADEAGVVESVKAASDVYAPIAGRIVAVNETLEDAPETVNESPYENGWFFRIEPSSADDLDSLLNASDYEQLCEQESH